MVEADEGVAGDVWGWLGFRRSSVFDEMAAELKDGSSGYVSALVSVGLAGCVCCSPSCHMPAVDNGSLRDSTSRLCSIFRGLSHSESLSCNSGGFLPGACLCLSVPSVAGGSNGCLVPEGPLLGWCIATVVPLTTLGSMSVLLLAGNFGYLCSLFLLRFTTALII